MSSSGNQQGRGKKRQKQVVNRSIPSYGNRFVDDAHKADYEKHYVKCAVVIEKYVYPSGVSTVFYNTLLRRNWTQLMVVNEKEINENLAREFFANIDARLLDEGVVYVRGVDVPVNREIINLAYELPPRLARDIMDVLAEKDARGEDWMEEIRLLVCPNQPWILGAKGNRLGFQSSGVVNEDYKVIFRYINNRLYPKDGNIRMGKDELQLFYALLHDIPVDIGRVQLDLFADHITHRNRVVALPRLITKLCRNIHVQEFPHDVRPQKIQELKRLTTQQQPEQQHAQPQAPPQPAPYLMSPSDRMMLRAFDSQRNFLQFNQLRMEDLMMVERANYFSYDLENPGILDPSPMQFRFDDDIEARMAQIRLEDQPQPPPEP